MKSIDLPHAHRLCAQYDMLPHGGTVLCALSGGADSVCLLHWLHSLREEYGFRLIAAHYNHQLRGAQSDRDEQFVRSLVSCLPDVDLVVEWGDVTAAAAERRQGIEETARDMRYAFLQQAARDVHADVIATAHNANDNAETFLLNLMRGCGLNGLCGIPPRRDNIVRPLLTTPRRDIEAYLTAHDLPHVEDGSNTDLRYTRNRVRIKLLPLLVQLFPGAAEQMTRTIARLRADEEYLLEQTKKQFPKAESIADGLSVGAAAVADLPVPIAVRGLRLLLEQLTGNRRCTAAHLQGVLDLCRSTDPSAQCALPGGITARRVYDRLELVHQANALFGGIEITAAVYSGQLHEPFAFYLASEQKPLPRPRKTGDRLTRPGRPGKAVKKLMIDEKIPRHLRHALPVLDCGGQVAGVVGLGPDAAFLPTVGQPCWFVRYIPNIERKSTP
ncbi:MAG: tRNA lysidine(34) synthetase TilS [Oscillospiraceae bacterium]|nr:tRNA lysidine(34) synthetase TilS [Oscillospiraceae bacterium]